MISTRSDARTTLLDELQSLPTSVVVYELDRGWFVASPTGLFVFVADDGDLASSCSAAAAATDSMRRSLASELQWVPDIDAMCATGNPSFDPAQPCLVIPADLVGRTVTSGPVTIDRDTHRRLTLLGLPRLAPADRTVSPNRTAPADRTVSPDRTAPAGDLFDLRR